MIRSSFPGSSAPVRVRKSSRNPEKLLPKSRRKTDKPGGEHGDRDASFSLFHRPADLRVGDFDHSHDCRRDISYFALPVSEYPEIAPPTIVVSANYPGASADVIADTVAAPLEQEINGVEGMLYISSQSTGNGATSINVVFRAGDRHRPCPGPCSEPRVSGRAPRLPEEVRRLGVTVRKNSPDLMLVIHLTSPDGTFDQQYISNYGDTEHKGRSGPPGRCGRGTRFRRTRLFHAGLARSGFGRRAQPECSGRCRRAPTGEPAGGGRLDSTSRPQHRRVHTNSRLTRSGG